MVCLGLKPGAARWKAQTNPLAMAAPQVFLKYLLIVIERTFKLLKNNAAIFGSKLFALLSRNYFGHFKKLNLF